MRRQFNNIVSVIHSAIRFGLVKIFGGGIFKQDWWNVFLPMLFLKKIGEPKFFLGKKSALIVDVKSKRAMEAFCGLEIM